MTGIEQLKQKMESDPEFAKSLKNAADENALLQKIREAGMDLTAADLAQAVSAAKNELGDLQLDAVAGGRRRRSIEEIFESEFFTYD